MAGIAILGGFLILVLVDPVGAALPKGSPGAYFSWRTSARHGERSSTRHLGSASFYIFFSGVPSVGTCQDSNPLDTFGFPDSLDAASAKALFGLRFDASLRLRLAGLAGLVGSLGFPGLPVEVGSRTDAQLVLDLQGQGPADAVPGEKNGCGESTVHSDKLGPTLGFISASLSRLMVLVVLE